LEHSQTGKAAKHQQYQKQLKSPLHPSTFKSCKPKNIPEGPNMKVSILHMKIRPDIEQNLKAAETAVLKAAQQKPDLIALPEYFTVPHCMADFNDAPKISDETCKKTLKFLQEISQKISNIYLLGGTILQEDKGKYYNTSTLWKNGLLIAKYKKINPIECEIKAGVARGNTPLVVNTEWGKVGMIICADSFDPELVKKVAELGAEIISLPVAAMGSHPPVKGHPLTEGIARDYGVFVLKVGNVSSSMRGGRSAIIAPWGILGEASDAPEDLILNADLDMNRLREYRAKINKT